MRRAVVAALLVVASPAVAQPAPGAAPVPSATAPAPSATAPAPSAALTVSVFRVHVAPGVDPSLSALVGQQLSRTVARLGWALTDAAATQAAATRFGAAGALGPERAAELVRATGARYGVFASVQAEAGRYRVSLQVVPAAVGAPVMQDAGGVSSDLYADIDRVLATLLPSPASAPSQTAPPPAPPGPAAPAPASEPSPEGRFRLALGTEVALGISGGDFRNHLVGARADYRFSPESALGIAVQYANLKGKEGRAHNVLPWAMFEYRVDLGKGWAIPLRYASGYLPKNGPVVHAAAGLGIPIGDDLDLNLELVAPTVWITHERTVLSADFALEFAYTL